MTEHKTNYESIGEWKNEGKKLFGDDIKNWEFVCPNCGNIQKSGDFKKFKDQGAKPDTVVSNCIGRYTGGMKGPNKCDWAAYGLFAGPVFVNDGADTLRAFDFNRELKK